MPSRRGLLRAGTAAFVSSVACSGSRTRAPEPAPSLEPADAVLVGGTVIDGSREPGRRVSVVIRGDAIALVPPGREPSARTRLDVDGRFIGPGLVDGHGHVPVREDAVEPTLYLLLQLAGGVTTVRCMQGTAEQLQLRDEVARGDVLGPRLLVGGMITEAGASGVEAEVQQRVRAGYDFIKVIGDLSRDDYVRMAAACRELVIPLAGHVPSAVSLDDALSVGQDIEHLQGFHAALAEGRSAAVLAEAARAAGCVVCPTIEFYAVVYGLRDAGDLAQRPELAAVPPEQRRAWADWQQSNVTDAEARRRGQAWYDAALLLTRALADAGVPLLASPSPGPFVVPGLSRSRELEHYARAGIDAHTQWVASIRRPNTQGEATHVPVLADGAAADLVVMDVDPRTANADVHATYVPHAVVTRGRVFTIRDLMRRVEMPADDGAPS